MLQTLTVMGAALSAYFGFLIFKKKGKTAADYLLAAYFVSDTVATLIFYAAFDLPNQDLLLLLWNVGMFLGPLLYLYVVLLIDPGAGFRRRYLVHFTPFVVSWIYMGAFVLTHDEQRIVHLFDESLFLGQPLWFQFFTILEGAIFPAYVVLTYLLIRRHRKGIANLFSYRETVDLTWLYHLVVGVGASLVLYGAADLWGRWSGWYAWEEGLLLGAALSTFCTIYVGYFGLRQQAIYATPSSGAVSLAGAKSQLAGPASPPVDVSEPVKYRHSSLSAADGQQYARHLLALMESERSYLNSKLSLQELAGLLGLSTHQVSQVINQEFGESFYDFVNRHRMEAFKRAIAEGRHRRFTLLSIAYDCGFNSKASFNRVFKKFTGRTPTQYVRAVEASPETS